MKEVDEIPEVEIYSDGGAEPNPGKGGYGVILSYKGHRKELSQGFRLTTNNRMELMGVIVGLSALKTKSKVNVYTDSQYVVNGIVKGWAEKWKANNWYRKKETKVPNCDLWENLLELIAKHDVTFNWIKGHAGHLENERCDTLADIALNQVNLKEDTGYVPDNSIPAEHVEHLVPRLPIPILPKSDKTKITQVGDLCRKCNTPVLQKIPQHKKLKVNQTYYFDYYLYCPNCKTMYMVDDAKRTIQ